MSANVPVISFENVSVVYRRGAATVRALDGISLRIRSGESVGIVGESGSGKTTLARALTGLAQPTSGEVRVEGRSVSDWLRAERRTFRRRVQMIFQDPYGSLNPRLTVRQTLAEVLRVHRLVPRGAEDARIGALLRAVGLDPSCADRHPHEFSGGQRQRIGIARALAVEPSLLIADEPVSALDVSVQAQVLNVLRDLHASRGLTLLLIAHDLAAVRYVCERIVVMHRGRIVEDGSADEVLEAPRHEYTRQLLDAVPSLEG
jgi:ABC-type oligopeptide transport system ATPase subunit